MGGVRPWAAVCLAAATTACTALLGATDVPIPDAPGDAGSVSDSAPPDSTSGRFRIDTGLTESSGGSSGSSAGSSSGSSGTSSGASSGSTSGSPDASSSSSDASSGSSGSASGGSDSGTGGEDSGCGPLSTTTNCGACGVVCDTSTGLPTCVNTTCTYACNPGHLDCNAVNGPDTDGCECTTPACCGTSCQTTHDNGVGQSYYDCSPQGTYNSGTAMEACQAYATGMNANPANCSAGWNCTGVDTQSVCYTTNGGNSGTDCWNYAGTNTGRVDDFACPSSKISTWN
jgi:hypothetical protein